MITLLLNMCFVAFALVFSGSGSIDQCLTDEMHQVYVLSGSEWTKYDASGALLSRASFNALGAPSYMDASNPLQPIIFYQETGQMVVLDNTFSAQHQAFDLYAETGRMVQAIAAGQDDQFWLFDAQEFALVQVDRQFRELSTSGPLFGTVPALKTPTLMCAQGNRIYLLQPGTGIFVFDQFGTYIQLIAAPEAIGLGFDEDQLLYHSAAELFRWERLLPKDPVLYTAPKGQTLQSANQGRLVLKESAQKWSVLKANDDRQ